MARWLILFCLFLPQGIHHDASVDKMMVWNVGQGLWITIVDEKTCTHFDMGGEFAPLNRIKEACQHKENVLYLSHWDLDHYRFINRFQRFVSDLCLADGPSKPTRLFVPASVSPCRRKMSGVKTLWRDGSGKTQNEKGLVYSSLGFRTLFPGDSPRRQESNWTKRVPLHIRLLILGHHGSRTATSETLLKRLAKVKLAIASARKEKYGHPHAEVIKRLKRFHIPMITTEDWGNLIFLSAK